MLMLGKCSVTEKYLKLRHHASIFLDMSRGCGHVFVNISAVMEVSSGLLLEALQLQ